MRHTIERLGHRGDGIAAGPVYAALTLPGEVIEGEVMQGRIAAPKIVTPSPDRVSPPCRHYRFCGGCALQHAADAFVAGWKAQAVREALAAQGLDAPIRHVITSPPGSRRRAVFSARRGRRGAILGFHDRGSEVVVDTPDCLLLSPEITNLFPVLRQITMLGATRKSELSITVTASPDGADISVTGGKPLDLALRQDLAETVTISAIARLTWNDELVAQNQPPGQVFDGIRVVPPPGAFLQATKEGETALLSAVTEAVGDARRIVDLFAGCGTFALPLARRAELHAVEAGAEMMAALDAAWRGAAGLRQVTTETRDLFRRPLVAAELNGFDAMVIDPPRAGARAQAAELAASTVPRIAMVSCNPASFARDARALSAAGYALDWIDVVDQFRWSTHVELAARFSRP